MNTFSVSHVPTASIVGMIITLVVSIGLPIILFTIALIKWKGKVNLISALIGAVTFILFALILEQILHSIMLATTGTLLTDNILLYAAYGGLAAGIFEETGRFVAMKVCMKRKLTKENAILYGIGHGGIESILLIGLTSISNILTSVLINNNALETIVSSLDADTKSQTLQQLNLLGTTPSYQFYLGGIERVSAILLHICLSYLVFLAIKERKRYYFPLAIFLHALIDAVTILLATKLSSICVEIVLILMITILGIFTYRHFRSYHPEEESL